MKTIFGPVNSRRFGTSLGIDLSPQLKQCNFDCLYCELTPSATIPTQKYTISVEEIIQELQQHLNQNIDVITITANGEPTLYPYLDTLIEKIDKIKKEIKTLILTNSAKLDEDDIFNALLKLDKVKLSLDAATQEVFQKVDRPEKKIQLHKIIDAIKRFSKIYQGELYIEILFVKNINDTPSEIQALNKILKELHNIKRIDIGTIDRPPAYNVSPLSYQELIKISQMFDPSLPIYIATRKTQNATKQNYSKEEILNTLDKRPLTLEDIKALFDERSLQLFYQLQKENAIVSKNIENLTFYLPRENLKKKRVKNT